MTALYHAEAALHKLGAERALADAARVLRRVARRTPPRRAGTPELVTTASDAEPVAGLELLSAGEREIAELVHRRRSNREIAEELFLAEKTVQTHLRNIFSKLGVSSRVAVAVAVEHAREHVAA